MSQLNLNSSETSLQEPEKNAEEYSRFAWLFQQKSNQTLGNLITTGDETQLSGSKSTGDLAPLSSTTPTSSKTDPKTQEDIQLLSGIIASEKPKNQEQNLDFARDENGSYLFDADRYEVGVIEGQLVISLKGNHENTETVVPESLDEIIDTENATITKVEKKSEWDQVITTITTKNVIKPVSSSKLSAQDLREAQEIFGS